MVPINSTRTSSTKSKVEYKPIFGTLKGENISIKKFTLSKNDANCTWSVTVWALI